MAFSFVRSLVRIVLRCGGDALGGGIIPIGSFASAIYEEWRAPGKQSAKDQPPPATEQAQMRTELEQIVQDVRAYRSQVDQLLAELGAGQPENVRQAARTYLHQVPGQVQRSLRRPEDPSGRTVPVGLTLRRAEDLKQLLPERMPLFEPGARPVPGTDLVVEELLGVGGFGEVWKARHQSRPHAPPVALKFCVDETAARTLRKEIELLDRISRQGRHRGIVELRYVHLEASPPCLEYEYVDGGDLACLVTDLHRSGKAKPLTMARLFCSLAQAVGFAHRIQPPIVHRDLKPANVLTTRIDNRVLLKVLDFGIGGIAAGELQHADAETSEQGQWTQSAGACTPLYASPQQRRGAAPDLRDDVYALGVIWYQMLVGDVTKEPPRGGSWKKRLLEQGTTPGMLALLERCLEDDPADRPADAQVLAQELLAIIKEPAPDAGKVVVAEEVKEQQVSRPPRPEDRDSSPDVGEARRQGDAAAFWFLCAFTGNLAVIVSTLAYALRGPVRSSEAMILFLSCVAFPGAAAACFFRATGSLKNFRGKAWVIIAIIIGLVSLLWAGLVIGAAPEVLRYRPPPLIILLSLVVILPTVLANLIAAIRGIRALWSAAVRKKFRRPKNSSEKLRPVFEKKLVIGLAGGLAGWFLLVLLVVHATRPGPTITKANFDKLTVGMYEDKVRDTLDPERNASYSATLGEVDEAFGSGPEELSRKSQWITAHRQGNHVSRYKDGDKIVLTCAKYSYDKVEMLCYSSTDPTGGRVSESKGSIPTSSKVTRENFDTLTVGMDRFQVSDRLGYSRSDEFAAALAAMPAADDKEGWTKAFNESRVEVFSDGAGTRVLVAYYSSGNRVGTAQAFYYIWTGLVPSDRLIAKKGALGE
jgi:serine/threonine protein kinase